MEHKITVIFNSIEKKLRTLGHKDVKVTRFWLGNTDYVTTTSSSAGIAAELRTNKKTGAVVVLLNREGSPQQEIRDVKSLKDALEVFSA